MKAKFITKLHNLKITENLGRGDRINDSLWITNDRAHIESLIPSLLKPVIGTMEVNSLLDGSPIIYSDEDVPQGLTTAQYLISRLYDVQSFLMTTWIYSDNAINFEIGFLIYDMDSGISVDSNSIAHHYCKANGHHDDTIISREKLKEIRTMHRRTVTDSAPKYELPTSNLTAKHPRQSRAMYFINAARGQPDIGIKIASYCTAFETLFASSPNELSHQLAERLSFYLFNTPEERLENYRRIKTAYSLRSKVVHGSTIKEEKLASVIETAEYCDRIARSVLFRIHQEDDEDSLFSKSSEAFEEAMLHLIFGGSA
jgi:hypothetical protein